MVRLGLILATVIDLGLAALLIGVSGFVFGGPEGMRADPLAVAGWSAMLAAALAAPILGFVLYSRGRTGAGLLIVWLPVAA